MPIHPTISASRRWRRLAAWLAIGLCCVTSLIALRAVTQRNRLSRYGESAPFDPVRWRKASLYGEDETRKHMLPSLLENHKLVGMKKAEVLELLGPPSDLRYRRSADFCYWIGPEDGFIKVDSCWLLIWVDDQGVVDRIAVVED